MSSLPTTNRFSSPHFTSPQMPLTSNDASTLPATEAMSTRVLCERLHQWCGVHLDPSKSYLINNRLKVVMADFGVSDIGALLKMAEPSTGMRVRDRLVDALTTHETLFFRDQSPFEALGRHIAGSAFSASKSGRPALRIWSAACSSGQEPYSIAIKLLETIPNVDEYDVSILASDVAAETVMRAKQGIYHEHEIRRGLTPELTKKYFRASGDQFEVCERVRKMVRFEVGNLNGPCQPSGPFDIIFCRNVLIYFRPEDALSVLRKLADRLTPAGYLFVGCSEVLRGVSDILKSKSIGQATAYQRVLTQ